MTNYTKTMMESLAEVRGLQEDNMDLMRKAAKGAMQTIKFKDGKLQMDSFTASGIMGVYDKVNTKNKKAIENIINSGTKAQIMKLQDLAMKASGGASAGWKLPTKEETELDEGKEKDARQLVNPDKEVMIVKKSKVVVIDKKDQDKYLKQGWTLAEEDETETKYKVTNDKLGVWTGSARSEDDAVEKAMREWGVIGNAEYTADTTVEIIEDVELDEGKMKDIINYDKKGMSVREIAKKLSMIEYEVKALLSQPKQIQKAILSLEEVEVDEGTKNDLIVMSKGSKGREVEKSVLPDAKRIKELEKEGWRIQGVIEKGSKLMHKDPKRIMKAIKGGDKLKIGEDVEIDEKFDVKTAATKKGKIKVSSFNNLEDAEKYLEVMRRQGHKGIISKGGKPVKEEVELDEAKYDLYHKDFSTAMQYAYKMAKKMYGITIDDKEIDDKVATGPKKPSEGKTNKYRLKGDKGAIQIQVYNKGGPKPYELNMYKEEVELDEAKNYEIKNGKIHISKANFRKVHKDYKNSTKGKERMMALDPKSGATTSYEVVFEETELDEGYEKTVLLALKDKGIEGSFSDGVLYVDKREIKDAKDAIKAAGHIKAAPKIVGEAWEIGTDEYRAYLEKLTPGETNEVEEASARADAMRHMRGGSKVDPADVDTDASDEDIKAASKHIIMQLRKAVSLKGNFKVEFGDKKKIKIPVKIAQAVIQKYNSIKKPAEKEKFQTKVAKSHRDMLMVLKAGYNESTDTVLGRIDKKLKERKNG